MMLRYFGLVWFAAWCCVRLRFSCLLESPGAGDFAEQTPLDLIQILGA
jgi:hypothetical protein